MSINRKKCITFAIIIALIFLYIGYATEYTFSKSGYELKQHDINRFKINSVLSNGSTYLMDSIKKNDIKAVNLLIKHKTNVNLKNKNGDTPLCYAIKLRHFDIVKILIKNGADINLKDSRKRLPLHFSATKGNIALSVYFVKSGVDINSADISGNTPLMDSVMYKHNDLAYKLITLGADVNIKNKYNCNALNYADISNIKLFKLLLNNIDFKCNKVLLNRLLFKAFDSSFTNDKFEIVKLLFQKGAEINARDTGGQTPLHHASLNNNINIISFLLKQGANINSQDNDGDTPLHNAVFLGNRNVAVFLIHNGANPYIKNKHNKNSFDIAKEDKNTEIMKILLQFR